MIYTVIHHMAHPWAPRWLWPHCGRHSLISCTESGRPIYKNMSPVTWTSMARDVWTFLLQLKEFWVFEALCCLEEKGEKTCFTQALLARCSLWCKNKTKDWSLVHLKKTNMVSTSTPIQFRMNNWCFWTNVHKEARISEHIAVGKNH